MSDVAKWKVRGAVETLRTEFGTWDLKREEWQPGRRFTTTSFRPDGAVSASDSHNPDGSIVHSRWVYDDAGRLTESNFQFNDGPVDRTVYSYDEAGRHVRTVHLSHDGTQTDSENCTYDAGGKKTKVRFLGVGRANIGYSIEGTEQGYGAPGATTMTTTYDERDLPTKVVFQDANHNSVTQVIFVRDSAGRLLSEEMHSSGESQFPGALDKVPPEDRERMAALLKKVFGQPFSSTTYEYDAKGRLIKRANNMGGLSEDRTTYRYDDRDDPIEETTEHRNREAGLDENGAVHYTADRVNVQHNRFESVYDAHGNWTERIVSYRLEPNPGLQRSNIERRAITYHALNDR
jgi:hypothetical protein